MGQRFPFSVFGGGAAIASAIARALVGDTIVRGTVPAGATATCKKNGTVLGAATVTPQGAASYALGSALVAGDSVSFPWTLTGETPAATVTNAPAPLSISGAPGAASVGTAYSFVPAVSGGSGAKTFSLTGTLPAGLSFSSSTGAITGTPTTAGTTSGLAIGVTDASGSATLSGLSIVVSAVTVRTQNIASAMRAMGYENGATSNGTDTAHNSVKWWVNESGATVNAVRIILPGWWTDTDTNGAERDISGPLTVTGSVEYPAGTRTQITFAGGATSGTVQPGANYLSDSVAIPGGIPAAAFAAIHLYVTAASGVKWPLAPSASNFFGGRNDLSESGAVGTVTDKTMTGAPTTTFGTGYHPIAILADLPAASAKKVVYAAIGDSQVAGAGDGNYDASNNKSAFGRAATGLIPYAAAAVTGTKASGSAVNGAFARRLDWLQKMGVTHLFLNYGTNDFPVTGQTPTSVLANWTTVANQANAVGIKVIPHTLMPRQATTSTQRWQTIASQILDTTGPFTAGTGSSRADYNDRLRAKPAPIFDVVELADLFDVNSANVLTRSGGYWRVGVNPAGNHLDQPYTGTVGSGATTTVIPTGVVKASNYFASYAGGRIAFTSGALAGTTATISSSDASGGVTLATALSSAPAQGDAFTLYSDRVDATNDGVHFGAFDPAAALGGVFIARDAIAAKLNAYLAP